MACTIESKIEREQECNLERVKECAAFLMKPLGYHNFLHVKDIINAIQRLTKGENILPYETYLLETAAYLHDIIYEPGAKDNEEKSALVGRGILLALDYNPQEIQTVEQLILATKMPTNPKNKLEEIICDADVDNLGREDFFEKCNALREENKISDKLLWYAGTLKFLEKHKYYTETAKKLRQAGLEKNIMDLKALVEVL